jgi:hypothetical protein
VDDVFLDHADPHRAWQALHYGIRVLRLFAIRPIGSSCPGANLGDAGLAGSSRLQHQLARLVDCGSHQTRRIRRRVHTRRVRDDGLVTASGVRCAEAGDWCQKTYVMMFAEKAGFTHVHFHVVPRMDDFPDDRIGPGGPRLPARDPVAGATSGRTGCQDQVCVAIRLNNTNTLSPMSLPLTAESVRRVPSKFAQWHLEITMESLNRCAT